MHVAAYEIQQGVKISPARQKFHRFVPQDVDAQQVNVIHGLIAEITDDIFGLLLVFHPDYFLTDLLVTLRGDAVTGYEMHGWE